MSITGVNIVNKLAYFLIDYKHAVNVSQSSTFCFRLFRSTCHFLNAPLAS